MFKLDFFLRIYLSLLEDYGTEIVRFIPIHDKILSEGVAGLYVGGGFPEFFLEGLEANLSMKESILSAVNDGLPAFAECAGLMYFSNSITDFDGKNYSMVGALNGKTVMTNKTLVTYSYAEATFDNVLCSKGLKIKGHEFHNSFIVDLPSDSKFAFNMLMGEGILNKKDGLVKNNMLASYMHIHFAQNKKIVKNFLNYCKRYSKRLKSTATKAS